MPKTLNETYDRILSNIQEEYSQDAFRVLQWLAFSAHRMTLAEVAEVICIDFNGGPHIDHDLHLKNPHDILVICSSLVTISTFAFNWALNYQDGVGFSDGDAVSKH